MAWQRWLWILLVACLFSGGCDKHRPKRPDLTKGRVTGIVLCADTGKPARFATVTLTAAPKVDEKSKQGELLPATESAVTDLDGQFTMEAVEPGHYYAFATLEGYLDPMNSLDFQRLNALVSDRERNLEAIRQWKDHLVEATVRMGRTSDLSLQVERGAEIGGTITFDDSRPAIGMHFQLFRKRATGGWTSVGVALLDDWAIHAVSDGHGRYNLTNLPAGEYAVCALMPSDSQDAALRVCLGNTLRKKDAATVKVQAGEVARGVDIEIPLSGLHTVSGSVADVADGHALGRGTVRLLYADDREKARESSLFEDGSFSFEYVPEGKYILQVSGGQDAEQKDSGTGSGDSETADSKGGAARRYAEKELPLTVMGDMEDLQMQLTRIPPDKPGAQ